MRVKILLYGIGSLGEKIYEYNKRDQLFDIVAFIDDKEDIDVTYCGLPVFNYAQCKERFNPEEYKIFVSIGYVRCSYYRELVFKKVFMDGYDLVNYVSPNAICWNGSLVGKNIFVADSVFVGHGSKIHNGVILYEACTLSHDAQIMSNCFLSLRVAMGGHTRIGNNTFIGLNTTVKDNVTIGAYNIVGCGANVIKSSDDYCVIIGNPGISTQKDTTKMDI